MSIEQQSLFEAGDQSQTPPTPREKELAVSPTANTIHDLPVLKKGWKWMSLGELVAKDPNAMTDGPFGSNLKTEHYQSQGPRVVRLQNIGDAVFNDAYAHISDEHFARLQKHRVYEGDIIIAALGETLPRSCIVPESLGPAIVKADCIRFKPKPEHSAKYLNYALNWEGTRKRTKEIVHGIGRPRLNLKEIRSILLPIAPPNEQPGIVEEIETQLSRIEAGVAGLRRAAANLKRYRAAVLKAAYEGRLVPTEAELARAEGRDYETGLQLKEQLLRERQGRFAGRGKYKAPLGSVVPDDRVSPEGWGLATVDECTSMVTDGEHVTPRRSETGILLLSARNVLDGKLSLVDVDYVPKDEYNRIAQRLVVDEGDVLLSCSGSVGRSTVVPPGMVFTLVRSVAVLKPLAGMGRYLSYALRSPWVQSQIKEGQTQTAQANIFQGKIKILRIPLPPLAEQARIVAEVERRLSVVDELEATVAAGLRRAARLRQAVLARAFSPGGA